MRYYSLFAATALASFGLLSAHPLEGRKQVTETSGGDKVATKTAEWELETTALSKKGLL